MVEENTRFAEGIPFDSVCVSTRQYIEPRDSLRAYVQTLRVSSMELLAKIAIT
jgi:hypothetical protein